MGKVRKLIMVKRIMQKSPTVKTETSLTSISELGAHPTELISQVSVPRLHRHHSEDLTLSRQQTQNDSVPRLRRHRSLEVFPPKDETRNVSVPRFRRLRSLEFPIFRIEKQDSLCDSMFSAMSRRNAVTKLKDAFVLGPEALEMSPPTPVARRRKGVMMLSKGTH